MRPRADGDPSPSHADIDMTWEVVEAARALWLQVHDHLVVDRDGVTSVKALGLF
jgi:DNA repair protein RadC